MSSTVPKCPLCDTRAANSHMMDLCEPCYREQMTTLLASSEFREPFAKNETKSDKVETSYSIPKVLGTECTIYCGLGDLTKVATTCIVNAANGNMIHASGLSGNIAKAAGDIIKDESTAYVQIFGRVHPGQVMTTRAGALPCKYVIHAVGPYKSSDVGEDRLLYNCGYNSLIAGNALGTSISIPGISSGIFGYPIADVAMILLQAAYDFIRTESAAGTLQLKEIWFTNFDKKTVGYFVEAAKKFAAHGDHSKPLVKVSTDFSVYQALHEVDFKEPIRPHPKPGFVFKHEDAAAIISETPAATSASSATATGTASSTTTQASAESKSAQPPSLTELANAAKASLERLTQALKTITADSNERDEATAALVELAEAMNACQSAMR